MMRVFDETCRKRYLHLSTWTYIFRYESDQTCGVSKTPRVSEYRKTTIVQVLIGLG